MEKVAAIECKTYNLDEVYPVLKDALQRIDFDLPKNKTVLIKPNIMSQNKPDQHSITHYSLIDGLCRLLRENGCTIQIGESIAFYQKALTRKAFVTSRIGEVAEKYGAKLIPFEEEPLVEVNVSLANIPELYLPKVLLEADMVINVCKLKTHSGLRLSGALKNMFGCLPGGYKQKIHIWVNNDFELSNVFLDLHRIVKPAVSIMDAIVSLDGGPAANGKPVKTQRILASTNAAALDVVACRIVGYEPIDISTLICARELGMLTNFQDVEVCGTIIPHRFKHLIKGQIGQQKAKDTFFVTDTYVDPFIKNKHCTQCGECIKKCPTQAIECSNEQIIVKKEKCINCYYCLSVCPVNAIGIQASFLNKFIRFLRLLTGI